MAKKGFKNVPGIPELYDEVKIRRSMTLTPTAIKGLNELAKQRELSRSELVERIGRGVIPLGDQV
jgi:hypothetical protein